MTTRYHVTGITPMVPPTDPTIPTLLNTAANLRAAKFFLDDLARTLPDGTTLEVVRAARIKLHDAETALAAEADALTRYAGLEGCEQ